MHTFVVEYEAAVYAPKSKPQIIRCIDAIEALDEIDLVENRLQASLERMIAQNVPWEGPSNKMHIEVTIENVHREESPDESDFVDTVLDRLAKIFREDWPDDVDLIDDYRPDGDNAF